MPSPTIDGKRAVFSASTVLAAIGSELSAIKHADGLTWGDLGRVLGKSEDQAAKYADGTAEMGVVAFAAAKREWNGRFTGALDRLCVESRPGKACDRKSTNRILAAAMALSVALEDGEVDPEEVRANRATLEAARDAIDEQLRKLVRAA
jgi:DNA-binding IclR family transcriptional regulator